MSKKSLGWDIIILASAFMVGSALTDGPQARPPQSPTGSGPPHTAPVQVSGPVQASPSLQAMAEVAGSWAQVPERPRSLVHGLRSSSTAEQRPPSLTGVWVHTPVWHSSAVQPRPSSGHAEKSGAGATDTRVLNIL